MKAVIDEDLHRSLREVLNSLEFESVDVRDAGLRGKPDSKIFSFAQNEKAVLFSSDLGFSNILRFPPNKHFGIVILRFPNEMPTGEINRIVYSLLKGIDVSKYKGSLIILSPKGVRIRRESVGK